MRSLTQPGNQIRPAVTSDGNIFLVVWQGAGDRTYGVQGARISSTGKILDARPHGYAEAATLPAASGSGGQFLITWAPEEPRGGTSGALIDAATGEVARALLDLSSVVSGVARSVLRLHRRWEVGPDKIGVWIRRTCGRSVDGTTPLWCPGARRRRPAEVPCGQAFCRSQPEWSALDRKGAGAKEDASAGCGSRRSGIHSAGASADSPSPVP